LGILKEAGDYEGAARLLMKRGLTYHSVGDYKQSNYAYQEAFMLQREAVKRPPTFDHPAPHALRMVLRMVLTLDPIQSYEVFSAQVVSQLFGRLLSRTPELDVIPDIAKSWEILDEGRTYLFHLRDDVRWSDGQTLTAADFVFSLHYHLDPASLVLDPERWDDVVGAVSYRRGEGVKDDIGIKALDPHTLLIQLVQPAGPFLDLLVGFFPLPKHVIAIHGQNWTEPANIVTSGAFLLESWEKGQSLCLKRNPDYYGHFSGNVERIELSLVSDHEKCLAPFEADEFDFLPIRFFSPNNQFQAIQRNASDHVIWPDYSTIALRFDTTRPPFDDPRLRRALVLATDRQTLAQVYNRGLISPATGGVIPTGLPGHMAGTALPYNPEAARKLLLEAGYPGGRGLPTIRVLGDGNDHLLQAWERELGLSVEQDKTDTFEAYLQKAERERYHVLLVYWFADNPDPDGFLRQFMQRQKNYWPDQNYFQLVESARQITDHGERMRLYRQAEDILLEACPIMPLSYGRADWLVKPWIKNFIPATMSPMCWKDIIIEPH
jgi:ABC-type oligopeptide transport system substrate-binding subunit